MEKFLLTAQATLPEQRKTGLFCPPPVILTPQIENADNNCPAEYIPPPDNDCHTDYHADITVTVAPVMKHETGRMKHSIKSPPEMVVIPADTNPSENHPKESEKLLESSLTKPLWVK